MEFKIRDMLFNRDLLQGYVNREVVKGLSFLPFLEKEELNADTFTWIKDDMSVAEQFAQGKTHEPRILAEGAKLEEVTVEGQHAKTGTVIKKGYSIRLSENFIKSEPTAARSILKHIKALAYGLGIWAEQMTFNEILATAKAEGIYNPVANKIGTSTEDYISTLIDYQTQFYEVEDNQTMNTILYNNADHARIKKMLASTDAGMINRDTITDIKNWSLPDTAFEFMGVKHIPGNKFHPQDTLIGFDNNNAPAVVYYGKERGAYSPDVMTGMEHFAPLINVTVQEPENYEMPKDYVIRMMMSIGVAVEKPSGILVDDDCMV